MSFMRAAVLANYPDVARQLGLDPAAELRKVGLSLEMVATPDLPVTSDAVVRMMESTAQITGCETVGLRMSQPRSMSGFGVVGLLLAQQPTLRDALKMVFRYLPLINESLALKLEQDGNLVFLTEEILTNTPMPARQGIELAVASNLKLFQAFLGADWHPRCVYFRHPAPQSLADHNRIFRCRCVFSSEFNGLSFSEQELDRPNPHADPVLGRYAESLISSIHDSNSGTMTAQVRRLIHVFMPLRRAGIQQIAQTLGFSVRKLQLDLGAEQTSFALLLEEARNERAQFYLQSSNFSIDQVSSLLGYNHPTSFTRWFGEQFGQSPLSWRKKHQQSK